MAFPFRQIALVLPVVLLSSCGGSDSVGAEVRPADSALPPAAWDHVPEATRWTTAVLDALDGPGVALVADVPADVERFCPSFREASLADRKAFWVGFLSALAEKESTWRPDVSGGGGRWHGLLQISPATAEGYGCAATTPDALRTGPANLRCAVRIMGQTVSRDGVIAENRGGVAADWGPLTRPDATAEIAMFTRSQPYCRAG